MHLATHVQGRVDRHRVAEGYASVFSDVPRLEEGMVEHAHRQSERETVVLVLAALQQDALAALQREIPRIHTPIRLARPHQVLFPQRVDAIQEQVLAPVGPQAMRRSAWA